MKLNSRSPGARRKLWIVAGALLLFTITGFFILPPIAKSQLEKRLSAELGRTVTVGRVRLNPYALSVTLENFDVRLKEGPGSLLGWNRLYVNFDALASLTGDWVLSDIELDGFHLGVILKADGSFNFSDILARLTAGAPAPAKTPAKPARPIRIGSLKVLQARVEFADQSRHQPFATVAGPLSFAVTEFRTVGARGAPYHFEAVTESGEKLAWTGTISAEPFRSVGELSLENIVLTKYAPYYADQVQVDLVEGKLSARGRYEVNLTAGQRVLKLQDGALQLRALKLLERASRETVLELPALDIIGVNVDALKPQAQVGSFSVAGGHLHARREKDGAINLLAMLQPVGSENGGRGLSPDATASASQSGPKAPPTLPATPRPAPAKLPDVTIGEVELKDFQVDLSDLAAPRPAQLGLGGVQFSLKNISLAEGASMPLQLSLTWAPQGTVHLAGTVSLLPLKADLQLEVVGLELRPLSPYLEQFVNARVTQGTVKTTLTAQVALPAGQPLAATLAGEVKIEKFSIVDAVHNEELAGFGALTLSALKATTVPQLSVSLAEVNLAAPYARVLVTNDKVLNLASVAKTAAAPAAENGGGALRPGNPDAAAESGHKAPPTSIPTAAPAPKIEIGRVVITEGDYSFTDRSVEPNVHTALTQFGGTISNLSSENMAKADVDLKATVDGAGPVAIKGQLDPLGARKFVDLKIDFRNVDLLPLSPYSGKYAGYELARGKLQLDVKFLLDGKKVDATNVITLNQFTFGSSVTSPDATGLPVRLGVALLKDMDGKIVIDVPVQGSIDDPAFRIGKVVWRVIGNLLTKAAVSPFALLGSMFGGGGDELGYQEFAPGAAELQPAEITKLDTMVKALTNRPGLSVDLEGSYDGPADTFVLKQKKLADTVRRAVWEANHALDPNIAPPGELVIALDENLAMVKKLFDAKFPPGTQFGAPLVQAPAAVAPPAAAKKGFFGRVVDVVTLKAIRSDKPKETAQAVPATSAEAAGATGPSLEEMTGRLAETMTVDENELRALAQTRAQQVRDYFITIGKIDPERLFLAKAGTDAAKASKGPRVFLNLQ